MADTMETQNISLQEDEVAVPEVLSQDASTGDALCEDTPNGDEFSSREDSATTPAGEAVAEMAPAGEPTTGEDPYADPAAWAELQVLYPDADPADPALAALMEGTVRPTLRQLYEAVHFEELAAARESLAGDRGRESAEALVEERIQAAVKAAMETAVATAVEAAMESAVSAAVNQAVCEHEERLLEHIRARGRRPSENGTSGEGGIHMHPAVERLTRLERAMLARRAENGETVHL